MAEAVQVIEDMPEEQYHAESGCGPGKFITRSILRAYDDDPEMCRLRLDGNPLVQVGQSDAMKLGRLFEAKFCGFDGISVLPPEKLADPAKKGKPTPEAKPWSPHRNACKAWVADKKKAGLIVTSKAEQDKLDLMYRRAMQDPDIAEVGDAIFNGEAKTQVTIRWQDPPTGLWCQVRVDVIHHLAYDIKTTSKPLFNFSTAADDYGYSMQDVFYTDALIMAGYPIDCLRFIVVQSVWPFKVDLLQTHPMQREYDLNRVRAALEGIAEGRWTTRKKTQRGSKIAELAAWQLYKYEDESTPDIEEEAL